MNKILVTPCLLAASVLSTTALAADVRFNGFASVVGGMTLNEGKSIVNGSEVNSQFSADDPSRGVYDEDLSFKPDTIFGLQVSADLGKGLNVTGQFTGAGGENFDANVAWAYISYELNDSWTMIAGRQRLPVYFYSDYLDVGYAYHWMRPPTEAQIPIDTIEGIQFTHSGSIGAWDTRFQIYGGAGDAETATGSEFGLEDTVGVVAYASNDWLQLRATYMTTDIWFNFTADVGPALAAQAGQSDEDPTTVDFAGVAAHATFGNGFVGAEYINFKFGDPISFTGWDSFTGGYITAGYRIGKVTPHITFSTFEQPISNEAFAVALDGDESADSVTIGIRWDFHPQAALKAEYQTRTDETDDSIKTAQGEVWETDVVSVGFDVIF